MSLTQDAWPGQPRVLPPLMVTLTRKMVYELTARDDATLEMLFDTYADVGQRLALALHSSPPLAQDEVSE